MNQHKSIARRLLPLAVAALFCSLFFTLIQCQITIGSKQQELAAVREQLSAQQAQNEELGRALADGKDAIIERSARADGYAKPNERIWERQVTALRRITMPGTMEDAKGWLLFFADSTSL